MNTWEPTALDLLTGLNLTVSELGMGIESAGYIADLRLLSQWLAGRVESGELIKSDEHPPRFRINKNKRAAV